MSKEVTQTKSEPPWAEHTLVVRGRKVGFLKTPGDEKSFVDLELLQEKEGQYLKLVVHVKPAANAQTLAASQFQLIKQFIANNNLFLDYFGHGESGAPDQVPPEPPNEPPPQEPPPQDPPPQEPPPQQLPPSSLQN